MSVMIRVPFDVNVYVQKCNGSSLAAFSTSYRGTLHVCTSTSTRTACRYS